MAIDAKTQRLPEIAVNQVLNSPLRSCSAPFSNLVHAVRFFVFCNASSHTC